MKPATVLQARRGVSTLSAAAAVCVRNLNKLNSVKHIWALLLLSGLQVPLQIIDLSEAVVSMAASPNVQTCLSKEREAR